VHLTETCDPDTPHLITHVETTLATEPDNEVLESIHKTLDVKDCLPHQHVVDAGYTSGRAVINSQTDYDIDLLGPMRLIMAGKPNLKMVSTFLIFNQL